MVKTLVVSFNDTVSTLQKSKRMTGSLVGSLRYIILERQALSPIMIPLRIMAAQLTTWNLILMISREGKAFYHQKPSYRSVKNSFCLGEGEQPEFKGIFAPLL